MSEQIQPTNEELVYIDTDRVTCDGPTDGRHPRVYLTVNTGDDEVVCPYCSRVFIKR
jgi:uncharacterized Zn-finger protein